MQRRAVSSVRRRSRRRQAPSQPGRLTAAWPAVSALTDLSQTRSELVDRADVPVAHVDVLILVADTRVRDAVRRLIRPLPRCRRVSRVLVTDDVVGYVGLLAAAAPSVLLLTTSAPAELAAAQAAWHPRLTCCVYAVSSDADFAGNLALPVQGAPAASAAAVRAAASALPQLADLLRSLRRPHAAAALDVTPVAWSSVPAADVGLPRDSAATLALGVALGPPHCCRFAASVAALAVRALVAAVSTPAHPSASPRTASPARRSADGPVRMLPQVTGSRPRFVGRELERAALVRAFGPQGLRHKAKDVLLGQYVVLAGPIACGKSRLAREYVDTVLGHFDIVLWLDATSSASLMRDVTLACRLLHLPTQGRSEGTVAASFQRWMAATSRTWFIIVDNVIENHGRSQVATVLPRGRWPNHQILMTSRDASPIPTPHTLLLSGLSEDEAVCLLDSHSSVVATAPHDVKLAVARAVSCIPLALVMAGRAWASRCVPAADVQANLYSGARLLERSRLVPPDYPNTLFDAVSLATERMDALTNMYDADHTAAYHAFLPPDYVESWEDNAPYIDLLEEAGTSIDMVAADALDLLDFSVFAAQQPVHAAVQLSFGEDDFPDDDETEDEFTAMRSLSMRMSVRMLTQFGLASTQDKTGLVRRSSSRYFSLDPLAVSERRVSVPMYIRQVHRHSFRAVGGEFSLADTLDDILARMTMYLNEDGGLVSNPRSCEHWSRLRHTAPHIVTVATALAEPGVADQNVEALAEGLTELLDVLIPGALSFLLFVEYDMHAVLQLTDAAPALAALSLVPETSPMIWQWHVVRITALLHLHRYREAAAECDAALARHGLYNLPDDLPPAVRTLSMAVSMYQLVVRVALATSSADARDAAIADLLGETVRHRALGDADSIVDHYHDQNLDPLPWHVVELERHAAQYLAGFGDVDDALERMAFAASLRQALLERESDGDIDSRDKSVLLLLREYDRVLVYQAAPAGLAAVSDADVATMHHAVRRAASLVDLPHVCHAYRQLVYALARIKAIRSNGARVIAGMKRLHTALQREYQVIDGPPHPLLQEYDQVLEYLSVA